MLDQGVGHVQGETAALRFATVGADAFIEHSGHVGGLVVEFPAGGSRQVGDSGQEVRPPITHLPGHEIVAGRNSLPGLLGDGGQKLFGENAAPVRGVDGGQ